MSQGGTATTSISVSSGDRLTVIGSDSGVVNVYDADTLDPSGGKRVLRPSPLKAIMSLTTPVTTVKFSPDGQVWSVLLLSRVLCVCVRAFAVMSVRSVCFCLSCVLTTHVRSCGCVRVFVSPRAAFSSVDGREEGYRAFCSRRMSSWILENLGVYWLKERPPSSRQQFLD